MRVLIVTQAPLTRELGAAQVALSLAEALCQRGHEAVAWSSAPLPEGTRWWQVQRRHRRRLEDHLDSAGPFDLVDAPAVSVSARVAAAAPVVARSVQPELRYLASSLRADLRRLAAAPHRAGSHLLGALQAAAGVLRGWRRARLILCLGSAERRWMESRLPWTRSKLGRYWNAPPPADQAAFAEIRRRRTPPPVTGLSYLWLGRWASHKGTRRLLEFLPRRAVADPEARFTIAGCGEAARRDCPSELLDGGRLRLVPGYSRRELLGLLAGHDAGLFTSEVEGWGLSLNEMLESGLPVFATEAGAVEDLRPCFPSLLRPFPPPERYAPEGGPDDPDATGYYDRFTWDAIARHYEEEVLGPGVLG